MSGIKRTTTIITIIGNDGNSGTGELKGRRMKKKLHVMCVLGFGI